METKTIGAVARLAGITVRTLRRYDDIGLLCPSERSNNSYQRHTDVDRGRFRRNIDKVGDGLAEICHKRLLLGTPANSAGWVCSAPTPFGCAASP